MELPWTHGSAILLGPQTLWCQSCCSVQYQGAQTRYGLMCVGCQDRLCKEVTVHISWDHNTASAGFTWAGYGGGTIVTNADQKWESDGSTDAFMDPFEAITAWSKRVGYRGPNPFSRFDYAYRVLPELVYCDPEGATCILLKDHEGACAPPEVTTD